MSQVRRLPITRRVFALTGLAISLIGGPAFAESEKAAAEAAAKAYLIQFESGDLGLTYDQKLGPGFTTTVDRKTFIQQMGYVRIQEGGPAQTRELVGSQDLERLPNGKTGKFYYVRFKSRFPSAVLFE